VFNDEQKRINIPEPKPASMKTPYGGRLTWTLPEGNTLVVHLKDSKK